MELTLFRLLKILRNKLWLIILITLIFGISAFIISNFLIKPKYQSSLSFQIQVTLGDSSTSTTDVSQARALKPDYSIYTASDEFLEKVADELNKKEKFLEIYHKSEITVRDLKGYISLGTMDKESSEFNITVTSNSPQVSMDIADEIQKNGPQYYKENKKFQNSDVKVIVYPTVNPNPVSPNTPFNTIFGFILGLISSCLFVIILESIDNSITDESDIIDYYEIPLLGIVYTHKTAGEAEPANKKTVGAKS